MLTKGVVVTLMWRPHVDGLGVVSEIGPRTPRVRDDKYLGWIRKQPCCLCGSKAEAAHIRSGSIAYGKRECGGGEKPDDRWTLPLCREHHHEQHSMREMAFYRCYAINPFELASKFYVRGCIEGHSKPFTRKPKSRKKIASRGFPKTQRKFK